MNPIQIAGYCVLNRLGGGAVGSVYKARSPTGRIVAIKMLNAGDEISDETMQRFRREFQVAGKVKHPRIVRYLGFGMHAGRPYIVMEFVLGKSLWDYVRAKGPMRETEAICVASHIGAALDASHAMKILHRDVKPNNIILTPKNGAKLTDFGLVKDLESTLNLTGNQAILGTPFFIPPEQFFDAGAVDRRADVYGLAASIYFALTGKIPFKFRGLGLLEKKLNGQFHPPDEPFPGVSPGVVNVIARALHPDPKRRPASAGKLAEVLRIALKKSTTGQARRPRVCQADRRSSLRRRCCFRGRGDSGVDMGTFPALITDISCEGVCLVLGRQFEPKTVLNLHFYFVDDDDTWDYSARVVNVQPMNDNRFRHGCRFIESVARAEVSALLNENKDKVRVRVLSQSAPVLA